MRKIAFLLTIIFFAIPLISGAQSIDLVWQAEGYTPPFYKGQALWSNQSRIRFLAIPHGLGNPTSLNYKWTKNGTVLGSLSGPGKNTLLHSDNILSRQQTVRVDIVSPDQEVLASASVFVSPILPIVAVYENNPLYGFMFHREVSGGHELKESEVTFTAFPLYFSIRDRADDALGYEWRTNTGEVETGTSITYRTLGGARGSSQTSVRISNSEKIVQDAQKSFLIKFGE